MTEAEVLPHEEECQKRIENWDAQLKKLAELRDLTALQTLKAAVDAQLALEDLRLKVRASDWAKTMTWGPLIFPALGAILGAFIGALLKPA
jgi:hypothetical protein